MTTGPPWLLQAKDVETAAVQASRRVGIRDKVQLSHRGRDGWTW